LKELPLLQNSEQLQFEHIFCFYIPLIRQAETSFSSVGCPDGEKRLLAGKAVKQIG